MKRLATIITTLLISFNASAEAYVLYDMDNHSVIESSNHSTVQPVASLSKLVTAMVCIDSGRCDEKLLERLLIRSDNQAAERIATTYIGGRTQFIRDMNRKVETLGLWDTNFQDPSGLSVFNSSTAREYIEVVMAAEKYPLIKKISSTEEMKVSRRGFLHNTNSRLLKEYRTIVLSKTGYTSKAGRCLALVVESASRKYAIIILGEQSPERRLKTAKRLINMTR